MKSLILICILCFGCLKAEKSQFDISSPGGSAVFGAFDIALNLNSETNPYTLTSISYTPSIIVFAVGIPITNMVPTTSGTAESYSISPANLPAGLNFDTATGIISGTPSGITSPVTFTVTATNTSSNASTNVTLSVVTALSGFTYSGVTVSGGSVITLSGVVTLYATRTVLFSITPAITGSANSYSVSPALPTGLSLNTTTGAISGTPTVVQTTTPYTITATNSYGSTTTSVSIRVRPLVFAATWGGGLGISTDGGASYSMKSIGNNSIETISICNDNTIYVSERGTGIHKSTDNGSNFSNVLSLSQSYQVYCDPNNSSNVYAVGGNPNPINVYRSTNAGSSFSTISSLTSNNYSGISSIGSNIYIASGTSTTPAGLYKSTDGQNFSTVIGTTTIFSDVYVTSSKVYALDVTNDQLLISSNSGASFPTVKSISNLAKIMVSSNDSNIFIATYGSGLAVSTDGGVNFNFRTTANGLGCNNLNNVFVHPDGTVYIANSYLTCTGGVSISSDNGNTFTTYTSGLSNLNVQDIYAK